MLLSTRWAGPTTTEAVEDECGAVDALDAGRDPRAEDCGLVAACVAGAALVRGGVEPDDVHAPATSRAATLPRTGIRRITSS